jgi:hypothetical protein
MELCPSWETNNCSATQGIPSNLWNPKVHYSFTRVSQWFLFWARLIQYTPSHRISWRLLPTLLSHLCLGLPSGLSPSDYYNKILYTLLFPPMQAICPAYRMLLDFIIQIIFGEEYKLWISPLCSFLQLPVDSTVLGRNILLSILF